MDHSDISNQSPALFGEFLSLNGLPSDPNNGNVDAKMVLLSILDTDIPSASRRFYKELLTCVLESLLFYPNDISAERRIDLYIDKLYDHPECDTDRDSVYWVFYRWRVLALNNFQFPDTCHHYAEHNQAYNR